MENVPVLGKHTQLQSKHKARPLDLTVDGLAPHLKLTSLLIIVSSAYFGF